MNLNEAYEIYCNNTAEKSLNTHSKKIREYLTLHGEKQANEAFTEQFLTEFIYSGDQAAQGKYSALLSFYIFIHTSIFKISKRKISFPLTMEEVKSFDREHGPYDNVRRNNKGGRVFLPRNFDLNKLFQDEYYSHLNNDIAKITIKAAIALGISAGYDSGEMFINNSKPKMKLHDPIINDKIVKVKNYSDNSDINYIEINGKLADYIRNYYKIRKDNNNVALDERDVFFAKLWDTRELDYDNSIEAMKPYRVQTLVYYMLKYISIQNGFEDYLTVTDLRSNLILHSLYNSKGASLKQIIKIFGFPIFVQEAFKKYSEHDNKDSCSILYDASFFPSSPQDENDVIEESQATGGEVKRLGVLINKIVRDTKIVRKLKDKYACTCQLCGVPLTLIEDYSYAEACHIQPLGREHNGIDVEENLILLCPNHHKLFDLGFFSIDPDCLDSIIFIDKNHILHNTKLKIYKHKLSPIFVRYHYENIFLPLRFEIYGY